LRVVEYSPATIKKSVTGNGRAEKEQVEAMVSRLLAGAGSPGKPDIADATATALCHLFGVSHADALHAAEPERTRRRRGVAAGV
jgi:crossover junction endodeoxyribonuclease RuvC